MGNYGIYIWPAYGLVLIGMIGLWFSSVLQNCKIKRHLKLSLKDK
ncbi:MAG: heme exporter protein CcmD [Proteobacteria bacterium]|nr:heme exporter protein CcmD [Pseudomonadota bacterium]